MQLAQATPATQLQTTQPFNRNSAHLDAIAAVLPRKRQTVKPQKQQLEARWLREDGRLVCKWVNVPARPINLEAIAPCPSETVTEPKVVLPSRRNLVARWRTVDGKLVCQWGEAQD